MTSYWKIINMKNSKLLMMSKSEAELIDLKVMLENFYNIRTKIIKCFGDENYKHDYDKFSKSERKSYLSTLQKSYKGGCQCKLQL